MEVLEKGGIFFKSGGGGEGGRKVGFAKKGVTLGELGGKNFIGRLEITEQVWFLFIVGKRWELW